MELKQAKLIYGQRSQNSVQHWGAGVGRGLWESRGAGSEWSTSSFKWRVHGAYIIKTHCSVKLRLVHFTNFIFVRPQLSHFPTRRQALVLCCIGGETGHLPKDTQVVSEEAPILLSSQHLLFQCILAFQMNFSEWACSSNGGLLVQTVVFWQLYLQPPTTHTHTHWEPDVRRREDLLYTKWVASFPGTHRPSPSLL